MRWNRTETADLLEEMPASVVSKILASESKETRETVNALLKYPKDSAGSVMTTEYVALRENDTSSGAVAWIREHGDEREDIYNIYVISEHRRLLCVVTVRELLLDKQDLRLDQMMQSMSCRMKTRKISRRWLPWCRRKIPISRHPFSSMPVLVALMPMLMDTGGNAGTQTSTLIIRGMAVDEIRLSDFLRVFWKEFRISLIVGLLLGLINGIRVGIQHANPMLGLLIFIILILDITIA